PRSWVMVNSSGRKVAARVVYSSLLRARSTALSSTVAWSKASGTSERDRKSTRLNSSHVSISYAVFCLRTTHTTVDTQRSAPLLPPPGALPSHPEPPPPPLRGPPGSPRLPYTTLFRSPAQLGDGELLGQEGRGEGGVLELAAGPLDGALQHRGVVEGERHVGEVLERPPAGVGHVVAAARIGQVRAERHAHHRHDVAARVAPGGPEGPHLLQVDRAAAERGLVGQHPVGGRVEVLAELHEAAGQGPRTAVGLVLALDQQRVERAVPQGQDGEVDSDVDL